MKRSAKLFFALGCLLICCSLGLLLFSGVGARQAARKNTEIVEAMELVLPENVGSFAYAGMDMPVMEIGGEDFSLLLEIPAFGLKLPVAPVWDRAETARHPCCFSGNLYEDTLIIGGRDLPGQFDFFDMINDGAEVLLTDMMGSEFRYVVERVERSDSADAEILTEGVAALTLFARSSRSLEYIIIRCTTK